MTGSIGINHAGLDMERAVAEDLRDFAVLAFKRPADSMNLHDIVDCKLVVLDYLLI